MKVIITESAERDLVEIVRFIANDSIERADKMLDRLLAEADAIGSNPMLYRLRPELGEGVRAAHMGNYLLLFRVLDYEVQVRRVVHGARNIPDLLQ